MRDKESLRIISENLGSIYLDTRIYLNKFCTRPNLEPHTLNRGNIAQTAQNDQKHLREDQL